jgi:hypothetical protein
MAFAPSNAYIIVGHGIDPEEDNNEFVVPDNCVIVVKAHPGEPTTYITTIPLMNKVGDEENQELYKNPLTNTKQIIKELGSVIIYKPGEKCPNYIYMFRPSDMFYFNYNGIFKTPLNRKIKRKTYGDDINYDMLPKDYIKSIYNQSIFPTSEDVFNTILKANISIRESNKDMTMHDMENLWLSSPEIWETMTEEKYTITQKELLQIDNNGISKMPGVYYNFVCRDATQTNNYYIENNNGDTVNISGEESRYVPKYYIINPNINTIINKKDLKPLAYRIIAEAETKRKPLIRNFYKGGKITRKNKTKRKNRKNRKLKSARI